MNNDVIQICGPYPDGFTKAAISSDANYVFTNDPDFLPVKVWEVDSNSVFVNSFKECEHYVSGGWNYIPGQNSEYLLQNQISLIIVFAFVTYLFIKKRTKLKK
jgi:hypothetical protein